MVTNQLVSVNLSFPKSNSTNLNAIINEMHIALDNLKELGIEGTITNLNYNEFESYEYDNGCQCASKPGDDS